MTNAPVEVITSFQRRRRWSAAEKEQLVAATREPGADHPYPGVVPHPPWAGLKRFAHPKRGWLNVKSVVLEQQ